MQSMVPNPMYANIGLHPGFQCTQGQFGVSQGFGANPNWALIPVDEREVRSAGDGARESVQCCIVAVHKKLAEKGAQQSSMGEGERPRYWGKNSIVSDRDARMTSLLWRGLFENMGTTLKFSSSFHPQTDGQFEKANSTVLDLLKCYVSKHKAKWEQYFPLVEYAYNNIVHSSNGKAPFEIVEDGKKVPPILHTKDKIFEADWLKLPENWKIHNAFHVSILRPYVGDVPEDMGAEKQPKVEELDKILVPEQILAQKERKVKGKVARLYYGVEPSVRKLSPYVFQWILAFYSEQLLLLLFLGILSLLLMGFFGYHLYLVVTNTTTNETYKWESYKRWKQHVSNSQGSQNTSIDGSASSNEQVSKKRLKLLCSLPFCPRKKLLSHQEKLQRDNIYNKGVLQNLVEVFFPRSCQLSWKGLRCSKEKKS
ncbi:hypothetical protein L7F22_066286 [Adiantum nelumboides]|nr:hypothetical protein [Adiantum nelumboides]